MIISGTLSAALGESLELLSASGKNEEILVKVLESDGSGEFLTGEPHVVLFLGLDDGQIEVAIKAFPRGEVPRPIYCVLTEENLNWPVSQLLEHLLEERRYWENKEREKTEAGTRDTGPGQDPTE